MHPPLFKPHPLCKGVRPAAAAAAAAFRPARAAAPHAHSPPLAPRQEVEALVKCHAENPYLKFVGTCNDAKSSLDLCVREEKNLRRSLNKKVSTTAPSCVKGAGEEAS